MLVRRSDITVLETRDYISDPKDNGCKSLHLLLSIPVFTSDSVQQVPVELQIRTIAMDFWASLEHKIYYKYDGVVPEGLLTELREAADLANHLDHTMERLHEEVRSLRRTREPSETIPNIEFSQKLLENFARAMERPRPHA